MGERKEIGEKKVRDNERGILVRRKREGVRTHGLPLPHDS